MILFAAGSQAPAWEPSREAPASRVHVISHAIESSWKMTRSWSFVVSVPKLELGNQWTCVIVTLIHDEPNEIKRITYKPSRCSEY
jgi:hypothetical protein